MTLYQKLIFTFVVYLFYFSQDASCGQCSLPFTCTEVNECNQIHEETGGLGSQILFKCFKGVRKFTKVCCPPPPGTNPTQGLFLEPESTETVPPVTTTTEAPSAFATQPGPVKIDWRPTEPPELTAVKSKIIPKPLTHKNIHLLPTNCGISLADKIISGENASRGEFPWMVLLVFKGKNGVEQLRCGGTIISSYYVLTAAHCFDDQSVTLSHVRLGEYNLEEERCEECLEHINDTVVQIIVHEEYDRTTYRNDIALLRLERSTIIAGRGDIGPICLPLDLSKLNITRETKFEAAGWGLLSWTDTKNSKILQKVNFTNNEDECTICNGVTSPFCPIPESQICIEGKRKKDVCRGDSGGPLMMTSGVPYFQIGVISFKFTGVCAEEGVPSIFTRVYTYIFWILNNMEP